MILSDVINGWSNTLFPDPLIEKLATERANICAQCPFLMLKNVCGKCGCPIIAKVRSLNSHCPMSKWKAVREYKDKETRERWLERVDKSKITLNL